MSAIYDHCHVVDPAEIDILGHVNNLNYLRWMMAAATAHSAERGWPMTRHKELGHGWVVRSHKIEYLRPVYAGERVIVRTWVSAAKRASSIRRYRMLRGPEKVLVADAATEWAYIDFQTGRIMRVPPEVAESFIPLGDDPAGI